MIRFGFEEMNLHKIEAQFLAVNVASGKVMQKAGMQYEGTLKSRFKRLGERHDSVCYGIVNE